MYNIGGNGGLKGGLSGHHDVRKSDIFNWEATANVLISRKVTVGYQNIFNHRTLRVRRSTF